MATPRPGKVFQTELPVDQPRALLHADQAQSAFAFQRVRVKADSIVPNGQRQLIGTSSQRNSRRRFPRVLGNIAQGFLSDPVESACDLHWNSRPAPYCE